MAGSRWCGQYSAAASCVSASRDAVAEDENLAGQRLEELAKGVLVSTRRRREQEALKFGGCHVPHIVKRPSQYSVLQMRHSRTHDGADLFEAWHATVQIVEQSLAATQQHRHQV
jgi:hypothetical protein